MSTEPDKKAKDKPEIQSGMPDWYIDTTEGDEKDEAEEQYTGDKPAKRESNRQGRWGFQPPDE